MSEPRRSPQAGGSILAGAMLVGAIGGVIVGEPSIGFLVGVAVGALLAILLWLRDRRR